MTEELKGTGDGGSQEKNATNAAGAVEEVISDAIKKAPSKDVGLFLKMIGVAAFLIALGIAISFVMRGTISVSATADAQLGDKVDLAKMKEDLAASKATEKPAIMIEQKIEGVQPGTTVSKTVTVETKDK